MTQNDIVQKLWGLCDVLRDDGINYSDYVTELVLLLFVKMEYEQVQNSPDFEHKLPEGCRWPDLTSQSGLNLLTHYRQMLLDLSLSHDPMIAAIYADAQTRLKEPRHLEQMVKSLDTLDWFSAREDGLGDLYEGLLEKNASETKSGAGQYFTPRALIDAIIRCVQPKPGEIIQDPAAGTAGFLIAADSYIKQHTDDLYTLDDKARKYQRRKAYVGMELVPGTRRLALMNCLLHGIEGEGEGVVQLGNSLGNPGARLKPVNVMLSNPPFGTAKGGGGPTRDDLTFHTSNKQLAFLQHIYRGLKPGGRAAVVLPDNVLFEAGVGKDESRQKIIDRFQERPGFGVIVLSTTAVGFGVNIQKANHVIHFTRPWNPAKEDQATDRAYRIGQENPVWVHCPTVAGDGYESFEQRLAERLARKRALSHDLLAPAEAVNWTDFEDLIA